MAGSGDHRDANGCELSCLCRLEKKSCGFYFDFRRLGFGILPLSLFFPEVAALVHNDGRLFLDSMAVGRAGVDSHCSFQRTRRGFAAMVLQNRRKWTAIIIT